ncbi:MAG TPA: Asp-tRNA(Asn)/Glu-tRNA(Gln) amidotransferase subunit GatA [Planctomycetia bacterium]|nr:Asp-tRNA(Asn)/Glu-tRNA(Gln) amidotransferase subunit GatA [Planctomycetia bacterium]
MLARLSAVALAERIAAGETTAEAAATAQCDALEAVEPKLKSFLHYERDAVLAQARAVDAKRKAGKPLGKLAGVTVGIKDVLCVKGQPTTCGSKILETYRPPYDAGVIERLRAADAILVGKLNMDEFAMGSSTENSAYQITRNPWNLDRVPGGSSGGSAASVAGFQVAMSLGTDTGGSIRQPAGCCGITGLKPTYGRVSRYGLVAYASSLDQIGPMARSVEDAALLLEALSGHDPRDSTSAPDTVPDYLAECRRAPAGLRIGVAREYFGEGLDLEVGAAVREAIEVFKSHGASVADVSLPHSKYAIATYYLVATAEASSNLARYDGTHYGHRTKTFTDLEDLTSATRGEGFGSEVKRRILLGAFALSSGYRDAYYVKALKLRRLIRQDYDRAFANCDLVLGPTAPTAAFKLGEKTADPLAMYLSDIYTVSTNLAGLPGVSIPCGFTKSGLPIGLQLQGPAFGETRLLQAGRLYQQATDWHSRVPAVAGG